jgi:alpha-beta hydrolase superfamily lysophospholipase
LVNWGIARGLRDGGFPGAVVVCDWTTGWWPLFLYHLRARRRNQLQAIAVARSVLSYQSAFPGRPVYFVAHSGGAALATWAMEALPIHSAVTGAVLLGAALSPTYSLGRALRSIEARLWNFWSPFDLFLLGAGTLLCGTMDGRHAVSAGCQGFSLPENANTEERALYRDRLRQRRYHPRMVRQFHLGGHFGWANRVFVAEVVAPLLLGTSARAVS